MGDVELKDIDLLELTLTGTPAVKEDFIMIKKEKDKEEEEEIKKKKRDEFEKLDSDALFALFLKAQDKDEDEEEDEEDDEEKDKKKKAPPEFNFDKTDEPTRAALRAIGDALANIPGAPEPVAEFAKSLVAKLPAPSNGAKTPAELIAFAKSTFPGLIDAVQKPLQEKLDVVQKTVDELEEDKKLDEMKKIAAEMPGDVEVVAKRLVSFCKTMSEEDFNSYVEEQKGLKAQITKSSVFDRKSSGQPATGSAEAIIMQKAEDLVAKSTHGIKTMAEAIEFVGKNDPVLWTRYQEEIRSRPMAARSV